MDGTQFRNVVGFLRRPTTADRRVAAIGHVRTYAGQRYTKINSVDHRLCAYV